MADTLPLREASPSAAFPVILETGKDDAIRTRSAFLESADIEGSFAIWYAKSLMGTCSSATWERYHAARRWVLLRCCAVCCGG